MRGEFFPSWFRAYGKCKSSTCDCNKKYREGEPAAHDTTRPKRRDGFKDELGEHEGLCKEVGKTEARRQRDEKDRAYVEAEIKRKKEGLCRELWGK